MTGHRGTREERRSISEGFASVTRIDKFEYEDFDSITSLEVHKRIVGFGLQAFRYCRNLSYISVDEENSFFSSVDGVLFDKLQRTLICYPANHIGSSYRVPSTVRRIADFAFSGSRLHSVMLPTDLVEIGDCAFEGCSNLGEIILPDELEQIGHVAFQGCNGIRTLAIPEKLEYITFPSLPPALVSIEVASGNRKYVAVDDVLFTSGMETLLRFPGRKALDVYEIPQSVKVIAAGAFSECKDIRKIFVPNTVTEIGDFAFAWLDEDQYVQMPEGLYVRYDTKSHSAFSLSHATFETY